MNSCRKTALAAAICTALSAGHAGAATFNVTNNADDGAGSLRDALTQANANAEADVIDLSSISGQTIGLTTGQLEIVDDDVTIDGAGVTVDAGGNSRVLATYYSDVTINDLVITGGDAAESQLLRGFSGGIGGGIAAFEGSLELNDAEVSGNSAAYAGGGVYFDSEYGSLTVNDSVISGNGAGFEGGGVAAYSKYDVTFTGSEISSNTAGREGGGIAAFTIDGTLTLDNSVVSGNSVTGAETPRGEFTQRRAEFKAERPNWGDDSRGLVGYYYGYAGGAYLGSPLGDIVVRQSTISGNSAGFVGGLGAFGGDGSILVEESTLSGNTAGYFGGGGVLRAKYDLQVRNSTISGNSAGEINGGLVLYSDLSYGGQITSDDRGTRLRNILIDFTTITANGAPDIGGLGIASDISIPINASLISGNTAETDPDIGFEPESLAQADLNFSLVGVDSTSGTLNFDAVSSTLLGQDPLLGALADNGGPTFTHLPAANSPVVDAVTTGSVGCGDVVTNDQRGEARPSDAGCEAGSVERGVLPPPPPPPQEVVPVPVLDRIGLLLMAGLLGLAGFFGFRRRAEQKF